MTTDRPDSTPGEVRRLIDDGGATLPLPGGGDTGGRWQELTRLARRDVVVGRFTFG